MRDVVGPRGKSFSACAIDYATKGARDKELKLIADAERVVDGAALQAIARYFKTARQFPRRSAIRASDYDPAVGPLKAAMAGLNEANLVARLIRLADELRTLKLTRINARTLNHDRPTSACSKFLWCAMPQVGVIFDQRARDCLSKVGHRVPAGDYAAYVAAFEAELDRRSAAIDAAIPQMGFDQKSAPWASRRLLDLWLYSNGTLPGRR